MHGLITQNQDKSKTTAKQAAFKTKNSVYGNESTTPEGFSTAFI